MIFHPEQPFDSNRAQHAVWRAVKAALAAEEGVAYYRYPIYRTDGFLRHEPDILLVLRKHGAFVIEVKGFDARAILHIEGQDWSIRTRNGETRTLFPVAQADDQRFAVHDLLAARMGAAGVLPAHAIVALPNAAKADWTARGFAALPTTRNVLVAEDLEPAALRQRLFDAARAFPPAALNDEQWARVQAAFGSGPTPTVSTNRVVPVPGKLTIHTYAGRAPDWFGLFEHLGLGSGEYTYLVATAQLAKARRKLAPPHQETDDEPALLFLNAIRHFLRERPLSRAEQRVLLARVARGVASNEAQRTQLERDLFPWIAAIAEVEARGIDASKPFPSDGHLEALTPGLHDLLGRLQVAFRQAQDERARPRPMFERAARRFIAEEYRPTPTVVMEGFTFLTPSQHQFIARSLELGAHVHLVHAYRSEQAHGFQVMRDTYARYLERAEQVVIPRDLSPEDSDLTRLQDALFSEQEIVPYRKDGTVQLASYAHRHHEVAACLEAVAKLLRSGYRADDIALVVRDPETYRSLIQEQAQLMGLQLSISLPPRALLSTPLGRFVLTLYQAWEDGALTLSADQFTAVLTSGWLGRQAQRSAAQFDDLRPQAFERCTTAAQWEEAFTALESLRASLGRDSRLPAAGLEEGTIAVWRAVIQRVTRLCERLFGGEQASIGEHVRRLLDELSTIAPDEELRVEKDLLERIREALNELTSGDSLAVDTSEFGDILNSLVRERAVAEFDAETASKLNRVWVTTPEGIDNATKSVVFYLGVDDKQVPRIARGNWPFRDHQLPAKQQRERYLFLAVTRAATEKLYLSYAQTDAEGTYGPSIYLMDVCRLLGQPGLPPAASQDAGEADELPQLLQPQAVHRGEYDLAELAHFGLCPYRYRMERLSLRARRYRDGFQLPFLAQGEWWDLAWARLAKTGVTANGWKALHVALREGLNGTRATAQKRFPALRPLAWHAIARQVEHKAEFLETVLQEHPKRGHFFPISFRTAPATGTASAGLSGTISVKHQVGNVLLKNKYTQPDINDGASKEWLIPGSKARENDPEWEEFANLTLFATQYHAYRWWLDATKSLYYYSLPASPNTTDFAARSEREWKQELEIANAMIALIERGAYPKRPGDHCGYCPLKGECLGVETQVLPQAQVSNA